VTSDAIKTVQALVDALADAETFIMVAVPMYARDRSEGPQVLARIRPPLSSGRALLAQLQAEETARPTDELHQYRRQELRNLMRYISEDCYCAGWLNGLEYILWEMVSDSTASREFGMGEVEESAIARLRELSQQVGGWWRWHDDNDERDLPSEEWGERFTPMADWLVMYERYCKAQAVAKNGLTLPEGENNA
jgi:hypothetical protein